MFYLRGTFLFMIPTIKVLFRRCCGSGTGGEWPGERSAGAGARRASPGALGSGTGQQKDQLWGSDCSLPPTVTPPAAPSAIWCPQTTTLYGLTWTTLHKGIPLLLSLLWRNKLECFTNSSAAGVERADVKLKCHMWLVLVLGSPNTKWHQVHIFSLI